MGVDFGGGCELARKGPTDEADRGSRHWRRLMWGEGVLRGDFAGRPMYTVGHITMPLTDGWYWLIRGEVSALLPEEKCFVFFYLATKGRN